MKTIRPELKLLLNVARAQAVIARTFDRSLEGGLGYTDFIILYHLSQAPGERMRRIDLANKLGLTASGITRLLLPMEKIGQVKREASDHDARVSFVALAPGGRRLFAEALETAERLAQELAPAMKGKDADHLMNLVSTLGVSQASE